MGLGESLKDLRDLHEMAKAGTLGAFDRLRYHAERDTLAQLLLSAQHVSLLPGQRPRRLLRVASALPADIEFSEGRVRAIALRLSSGGFGALLPRTPHVGDRMAVTIRVPGGPPLHATARVVSARQQASNANASFEFVDLAESDVERMEMFVFDAIWGEFEGV